MKLDSEINFLKSDMLRYSELNYLKFSPNYRKVISAVLHSGFRTSCYFRIQSLVLRLSPALRITFSPIILIIKLILIPNVHCELSPGTDIGPGLFLPHPFGVVIAPQAKLGKNCNVFSDVVLGINHLSNNRAGPSLGDNVTVYAGAKIIGGVHIGSNVIIGANSVVTKDVPANAIVVGVPAKIIRYREASSTIPF